MSLNIDPLVARIAASIAALPAEPTIDQLNTVRWLGLAGRGVSQEDMSAYEAALQYLINNLSANATPAQLMSLAYAALPAEPVPVGGAIYRAGKPVQLMENGCTFLRAGFVETDPAKFVAEQWTDNFGNHWEPVGEKLTGSKIIWAEGISKFVALSGASVLVAATLDGEWTQSALGFQVYDICAGPSLIVAVGSGGAISTSPDGITWTARSSGTSEHLFSAIYMPQSAKFVVGGNARTVRKSDNGSSWVAGGTPLFGASTARVDQLVMVSVAGVEYVAAASSQSNEIAVNDVVGLVWNTVATTSAYYLQGLVSTGEKLVAFSTVNSIVKGVEVSWDSASNPVSQVITVQDFSHPLYDNTKIEAAWYCPVNEKIIARSSDQELYVSDAGNLMFSPAVSKMPRAIIFCDGTDTYMCSGLAANSPIYKAAPSAGSIMAHTQGGVAQYIRIK